MRRLLYPALFTLLALLSGSSLLAQDDQDDALYWILDRVETSRSENIPFFSQSENSLTYRRTHSGYVEGDRVSSNYVKRNAEVTISANWSVPNRIPYLEEDKVRVGWSLTSSPRLEHDLDVILMDIPTPWEMSVTTYTQKGVDRSDFVYEPGWEFEPARATPCYGNISGTFDTFHSTPDKGYMKYFLPDGSWTLIITVRVRVSSDNYFGSTDPMSGAQYKNYFSASTRYYYRFHGQAFVEVENVKPASKERGDEENGSDIPWEIFLIPPGAYVGWRVIKRTGTKRRKRRRRKKSPTKPTTRMRKKRKKNASVPTR